MGDRLLEGLRAEIGDHPNVGDIRGKGLMVIVETVADRATKAKYDVALNKGGALTKATREQGLIVRASNDGIAIAPPLIISADEVDTLVAKIAMSVRTAL
jgi:adenosylmethionine-8-amino-7-oxononanoate aminotransferase